MAAKNRNSAMTMVELITVLAIIALLLSILIPVTSSIRKAALEAKQTVQIGALSQALEAFKKDYGDYPPSEEFDANGVPYCGAQKLAEAIVGWDLLGFHPKTAWDVKGYIYDNDPCNLRQRYKPYIESQNANAYNLKDLFKGNALILPSDSNVICDTFARTKISIGLPGFKPVVATVGLPILYYKANTSKIMVSPKDNPNFPNSIYNCNDNLRIIKIAEQAMGNPTPIKNSLLGDTPLTPGVAGTYFYDPEYKIIDKQASSNMPVDQYKPYNPDSFLLISAGYDGLYGTPDDVTNIK